nr:glutamate receptor 2.7-like [Ziziphus jujuba var. spinosa]
MMSEGYAWMVTAGLSSVLVPYTRPKSYASMHGVVGVRPYLPNSKLLQDFKTNWNKTSGDINLFGLWAYDTIWALAMAAESVNPNALIRHKTAINSPSTTTEPFGLRVSESGPELLKMLLHAKFECLSGKFNLIGGQIPATDFEIINVRKKLGERVIGNWTQLHDQSLQIRREAVIWPGNTKVPPKGWVQPVVGKRLRIGVPVTSVGFKDFLEIEWDPRTNETTFSGFSFRENNGTYDELLYQIKLKNFDAVVGDTTITANRSTYVHFTLPYIESGILMVVKVKDTETKNIWIFLKPLRWDLWLTIGLAFVFTGLRPYTSPEEYNDAMSKGSLNGGIDAIFDEIPNVKLLLAKYCSRYTVTGPTTNRQGLDLVTNRFDQNHSGDNLQIPPTAFSLEEEIAAVHVEDEGNHIHYIDSDQYVYGCA